jgi:hypothetical protein
MAQFKISGVWKNSSGVITHYAFHEVGQSGASRAMKVAKADAVQRVESSSNSAVTWIWDYKKAAWKDGEKVEVISGVNGKYLRSNRDDRLTDNLAHLIDFNLIAV